MCTHMHLCWISPLCFGTDRAPPWTVLPFCSSGKGRISQQRAGQQQLVGSAPCNQSAGMGAWDWEQTGDTAFEEGQQAKAVQVLVWWSSVLLPGWTFCVVLLPPLQNRRCWVTGPSNKLPFWTCLPQHHLWFTICFLPHMVQKPFFGLNRFFVLGAWAIQRWELKYAFPFLGRVNGILGASNIFWTSKYNRTPPPLWGIDIIVSCFQWLVSFHIVIICLCYP